MYSSTCMSRSRRNENSSDTGIITDITESESLEAKVVSRMAQLHTFDVYPETDIITNRGQRSGQIQGHVSPVTLGLTSLPCRPSNSDFCLEQTITFSRYCLIVQG